MTATDQASILLTGLIVYTSDESIKPDNCSVHAEYQHAEDAGCYDAAIHVHHHRPEASKWAYEATVGECCLGEYLRSLMDDNAINITIRSPRALLPVVAEVMGQYAVHINTCTLGGVA